MANPRPSAAQLGLIAVGAAAGAGVGFFLLPVGAAIAGGITGVGAALGAIPYSMSVKKAKEQAEADGKAGATGHDRGGG